MHEYRISSNLPNDADRRYFELQLNTIWCRLALIQNSDIRNKLKNVL